MAKMGQVLEWGRGGGTLSGVGSVISGQLSGIGRLSHGHTLATAQSHNCLKVACNPIAGMPESV